jgi:hypothetical protein
MVADVEVDYRSWGVAKRLTADQFLASDRIDDGVLVIEYGAVELPMLIRQRGSPATFYGFHAAMHPINRRALPFFQGRRIAPARLNTVLLCDPSLFLHPEVTVGWFLGSRAMPLLALLPPILEHLDRLMGASRRLLWGNSAGGTAALVHARKDDVAVAINPQIALERFTWSRVRPWTQHGWDAVGRAEELAVARDLGDVRNHPPRGRVVYVQNTSDDHIQKHMPLFREVVDLPDSAGEARGNRLVLGHWGEGHVPPDAAFQRHILAEEAGRLLDEMGVTRPWHRRLRDWMDDARTLLAR